MALSHTSTEVNGQTTIESFDRPMVQKGEFLRVFGNHRLAGTASIEGTPSKARVIAINRMSGQKVVDLITAADGTWSADNIAAGEYTVLVLDLSRTLNAATADMVRAVPMA